MQITVSLAAPTNLVYPQALINATTGTAISPDVPTVTGLVTGYVVSPALPAGLTLNTSSGVIAGTPTAPSATTTYMVTASNTVGSTTASLQITVSGTAPSNLIYPQATINATVGAAIAPDTPTVNGVVTGYSISPLLPAGLSLDTSTGTISGTPTAASAQTPYTVTAQNGNGTTTAQVTITVAASPVVLYQGGHQAQITSLHSNSDRLLSTDDSGHWILWDYSSGNIVAQGDGARTGDLEGQIFGVNSVSADGFQIRSAQDGSLISSTLTVSSFGLPADGSYVFTATPTELTIWSPSGASEVMRDGDYSKAAIFAAPGQVLVAKGAAGQNVIETIDVASGTSTVSPTFSGTFQFWFGDGSNFVTQLSNVYWVYSNASTQEAMGTTPSGISVWSGGAGSWLWGVTTTYNLEVFAFGSMTPAQTFQLPFESELIQQGATVVAFDNGYPDLSTVDFSGATPTISKLNLPSTEAWLTAYTKNSSGELSVGNQYGVVMDATNQSSPRYFDDGQVLGLAAGGNTAAVATASGRILLYDITTAQQMGTINFLASQMEMSSDGTVLAAGADALEDQYAPDRSLRTGPHRRGPQIIAFQAQSRSQTNRWNSKPVVDLPFGYNRNMTEPPSSGQSTPLLIRLAVYRRRLDNRSEELPGNLPEILELHNRRKEALHEALNSNAWEVTDWGVTDDTMPHELAEVIVAVVSNPHLSREFAGHFQRFRERRRRDISSRSKP